MSNRSIEFIQGLLVEQASAPAAPVSGDLQLWAKTDNTLHYQTSAGVDAVLAILGAQSFTGLQTFNAGISIPTGQSITGAGTAAISGFATGSFTGLTVGASNLTLGANHISYGGTAAGLNFDASNNATFSGSLTAGAISGTGSVVFSASGIPLSNTRLTLIETTPAHSLISATGVAGNIFIDNAGTGNNYLDGITNFRTFAGATIAIFSSTGLAVTGTLSATGTVSTGGYTVAGLPAAGTKGRMAYVTDATAPTYLGTLTGGGAVNTPVFDNGTAWVSF